VKLEGKRPLFKSRRRRKGSDKIDIKVIWYDSAGWINLAQETNKCYSL
jgi:hypothetical protein